MTGRSDHVCAKTNCEWTRGFINGKALAGLSFFPVSRPKPFGPDARLSSRALLILVFKCHTPGWHLRAKARRPGWGLAGGSLRFNGPQPVDGPIL